MHNYCGPFYAPKWFKRWWSKDINHACYLHDLDYAEGKPKIKADYWMFQSMLKTAFHKRSLWILIKAFLSLSSVLILGFISYRRASKNRIKGEIK